MAFFAVMRKNLDNDMLAVLDTNDGSIEWVNINSNVNDIFYYITKVDIVGVIVSPRADLQNALDSVKFGQSVFIRNQGEGNYMIALNRWNRLVSYIRDAELARRDAGRINEFYKVSFNINFALKTLQANGVDVNTVLAQAERVYNSNVNTDVKDSVDIFNAFLNQKFNR